MIIKVGIKKVDDENGNYDYLMGTDLDFSNEETVQEVTSWLHWYLDITHIKGLRLDAVKHIPAIFIKNFYQNYAKIIKKNFSLLESIGTGMCII